MRLDLSCLGIRIWFLSFRSSSTWRSSCKFSDILSIKYITTNLGRIVLDIVTWIQFPTLAFNPHFIIQHVPIPILFLSMQMDISKWWYYPWLQGRNMLLVMGAIDRYLVQTCSFFNKNIQILIHVWAAFWSDICTCCKSPYLTEVDRTTVVQSNIVSSWHVLLDLHFLLFDFDFHFGTVLCSWSNNTTITASNSATPSYNICWAISGRYETGCYLFN